MQDFIQNNFKKFNKKLPNGGGRQGPVGWKIAINVAKHAGSDLKLLDKTGKRIAALWEESAGWCNQNYWPRRYRSCKLCLWRLGQHKRYQRWPDSPWTEPNSLSWLCLWYWNRLVLSPVSLLRPIRRQIFECGRLLWYNVRFSFKHQYVRLLWKWFY